MCDGNVNVGKVGQRPHHGKFVGRYRPEPEGQSIQLYALGARQKPADLRENSVAVIVTQLIGWKLLRMCKDAPVLGNIRRIWRVGADHRAIGHLFE
jgi:hypothetical protein